MKFIYEDTVKKYENDYRKYFKSEIENTIPGLEKPKTMGELIYKIRQIYEVKKIYISLTNEEIKLKSKITGMTGKKENISSAVFILMITIIISIAVPTIQATSDINTQQLGKGLELLMYGETIVLFIVFSVRKFYENWYNNRIGFYSLCLDILQKVRKGEFE